MGTDKSEKKQLIQFSKSLRSSCILAFYLITKYDAFIHHLTRDAEDFGSE